MKKYMIVYSTDDGSGVCFCDEYNNARNVKLDVECGFGGYAEIYIREEVDEVPQYVLLEC